MKENGKERFECPICEMPIPHEATVYKYITFAYQEERWICEDCFMGEVGNMSPRELADLMGVEDGKAGYVNESK